ncbi:Hypothetical protein ERS075552_00636 [Mycobacteroides abscessus]|uniref:hypothetical protein n=1 Tax=Mycobacteroides abscessus TaxID=36809 RepID=UPI0003069E52|nr:hypothetical protein [Mycobacteroides abscessus]CPT93929.1 Hypothetical protein ERS075552_00636 [Mycobacteroides abscessus]CPW13206.1 Hypothetical protein ERS075547_01966 [Mycobacteroides abscessus]CQA03660.1 Hypothetical protein ERS075657_04659 [Mycobacteroides abscessus]SHZ39712.1 Uncharacterised protein [Mycobacteroides abscessus subsp. abscessus]SHZ41531.1 Uncharacterised protein [Mycobacteroides abscessus subsp. abscessus]
MSDDKLKLDLEALDKLSPELSDIAKRVNAKAASPAKIEAGEAPSLVAVRELVTQAIPGLQRAFAGRCSNVADLSVQTKNGFGDTEEHVTRLIASVTGLSRGGR